MPLVFATNNLHKLAEVQHLMPPEIKLMSLEQAGFFKDIAETGDTLEDNAAIKARTVYEATGLSCFADDTGLEVDALGGKPGVHSARYAGIEQNSAANLNKLLFEMRDVPQRQAQFRTAICLIIAGKEYCFEGIVRGHILSERIGDQGFGYDPVFVPEGHQNSFASMDLQLKNQISHRARAISAMLDFIKKHRLI